jgi:hypothetical protein
MQFGLQKPIFAFDYRGNETSQIIDSIKNLATSAENKGFDSFWEYIVTIENQSYQ